MFKTTIKKQKKLSEDEWLRIVAKEGIAILIAKSFLDIGMSFEGRSKHTALTERPSKFIISMCFRHCAHEDLKS